MLAIAVTVLICLGGLAVALFDGLLKGHDERMRVLGIEPRDPDPVDIANHIAGRH